MKQKCNAFGPSHLRLNVFYDLRWIYFSALRWLNRRFFYYYYYYLRVVSIRSSAALPYYYSVELYFRCLSFRQRARVLCVAYDPRNQGLEWCLEPIRWSLAHRFALCFVSKSLIGDMSNGNMFLQLRIKTNTCNIHSMLHLIFSYFDAWIT